MKINYLILSILLFAGCTKNNGKSDAYGNFETEPVMASSEMPGKVLYLTFSQGDRISKEALLAVIDTVPVTLQIEQIKAQIAASGSKKANYQAQAEIYYQQIKNLQVDQKRMSDLFKDGAATQKQLDDLNGQIKVLDKQVESVKTLFISLNREIEVLESQLAVAENNRTKCYIRAPVGGTVLEKYLEEGEVTAAGRSVAKIADLDELILKVYVSGNQLPAVKIGQEAEVIIDRDEEENRSLKGTVTWISPEAEFTPKIIQTREERVKLVYAVKIKVKNDGTLKIGMPGEANFRNDQ